MEFELEVHDVPNADGDTACQYGLRRFTSREVDSFDVATGADELLRMARERVDYSLIEGAAEERRRSGD